MGIGWDAWAVIVAVAIFGLSNAGIFLYKFGGMNVRLGTCEDRHDRAEERLDRISEDVAELKGEAKAWQVS